MRRREGDKMWQSGRWMKLKKNPINRRKKRKGKDGNMLNQRLMDFQKNALPFCLFGYWVTLYPFSAPTSHYIALMGRSGFPWILFFFSNWSTRCITKAIRSTYRCALINILCSYNLSITIATIILKCAFPNVLISNRVLSEMGFSNMAFKSRGK